MMYFLGPLGPMELILILLVVLVIFGARRLPEIGEGLGKGIRSFKKAITEDESTPLKQVDEKKEVSTGDEKEE